MSISLLDRYRGALIGLACGDAVGCSVEFYPRGRFVPVTDMIGGGKFRLQPGEWTDDTSMTLCLATSLVEKGGHDPLDQMQRYSRWFVTGQPGPKSRPVGIGKTVLQSIFRFRKTGEPYAGDKNPKTAGNGALMRLAPIVLAYFPDWEKVEKYAKLSTMTTHQAAECLTTSGYLAKALYKILSGDTKESIEGICKEWQGLSRTPVDEIHGTGYAPESLKAAVWSFVTTDSFHDAILTAVNLGDDADTTAAICGQMAGAYYGIDAIPQSWKDKLYLQSDMLILAEQLLVATITNKDADRA